MIFQTADGLQYAVDLNQFTLASDVGRAPLKFDGMLITPASVKFVDGHNNVLFETGSPIQTWKAFA